MGAPQSYRLSRVFPFLIYSVKNLGYLKTAELQLREGMEDNSKNIFFLYLNKNVCCDPSLEPSRQDGSHVGSQNMFCMENYG